MKIVILSEAARRAAQSKDLLALATMLCIASPLHAQVTTAPALGPAPKLSVPVVQTASLPNGLKIQVARNAEVPLVEARLIINGGARLRGTTPGLATFTAGLLGEGAGGMTALKLAEETDFIGASLRAGAGYENVTLSLSVPKRSVDRGFQLMALMLLKPTFSSVDINRQRSLRLAGFTSERDSPNAVAGKVFYRNIFPASHPYHGDIDGDSASVVNFDSVAVRNWWATAADPRRTTLVLSGDVTLQEAVSWAAKHFSGWKAPSVILSSVPARDVSGPTQWKSRVILVDKPDAAQSVIMIGGPGMSRSDPDYPAVMVMNTILGGSFSARLNDLLREQLGYTYGAGSDFSFAPVAGPFVIGTDVRTDVTDSSLVVIFREIAAMREKAVTDVELARARNYLVLGSLSDYETASQVAGAMSTALLFRLPLATIPAELARINAVTAADVQRMAKFRLNPAEMTVVIVGDLAKIRAGIEKLGLGPVEVQTYEK
ncbi:MAG: insulinase family protein [Gemmatimonadetes bacterium]|nr:insulinase family protein [Gemmatimonadota bacterium]